MSTDYGEVKDWRKKDVSITVGTGVGGIKIVASDRKSGYWVKVWLDDRGVDRLKELLEIVIAVRDGYHDMSKEEFEEYKKSLVASPDCALSSGQQNA